MSSYIGDISQYANATLAEGVYKANGTTVTVQKKGANLDLDMQDFLQLMITQMTNQGIDDTMDTSEMLNQMVQMQMITALTNMTDASVMSYAASLVNKTVTVAEYDGNSMKEVVGTVQGTGMLDGQQVIIVNDKYYNLSDILAVGTLPALDNTGQTGGTDQTEGPDKVEDPDQTEDETENTDETEGTEEPGGNSGTDAAEDPVYTGEDGVPNDVED